MGAVRMRVMPVSHILRLRCVFFSAPMLTDQSIHTACGCGPAVRSRSGVSAAVQRSFPHRVYFCCAARAELKSQLFVHGKNEHGLTQKCSNFTINRYN